MKKKLLIVIKNIGIMFYFLNILKYFYTNNLMLANENNIYTKILKKYINYIY